MKKWLVEQFLPMWAKETVLRENRLLRRELRKQQKEIDCLKAYIKGLERGRRKERNGDK